MQKADAICNASRYQHSPEHLDSRAGSYKRKLLTTAGQVELTVPRLRRLPFETQIIQRYKTKQSSVEEALIEMYLAGISVRRVEDITEALWDTKISSSTVSDLNKKIYSKIESWRMQPIQGKYPYIFVDGVYLKRSWAGEVHNISVLVAIGVNSDGYREILGVAEGSREDKESWSNFFRYLKERGLDGVKLVISDKASGLVDVLGDFFPEAKWQRCVVHWYRNAFNKCPNKHIKTVTAMLKAIHSQEDKEAARQKAILVAKKMREMKLDSVAKFVEESVEETLSYMDFPSEHWVKIRTNNGLERIMKEIRRRTRVVGCFPDGYSAMMLVGARLKHISTTKWGTYQYLCTSKIYEQDVI
jgi:transposase-like protein